MASGLPWVALSPSPPPKPHAWSSWLLPELLTVGNKRFLFPLPALVT